MSSNWNRIIYTIAMCYIHFSLGIGNSSIYPTYVDLKYIMNTSMSNISLVSTFGVIGYAMGSLFGFLYGKLNRQLTLIVLWILMGVAIIYLPHSPDLFQLYLSVWIYNLGYGAWNNANNVWLIEMWQQKSGSILQLSQFMYGIGTIFGPLIEGPYLSGEPYIENQTNSIIVNITEIERTERRDNLKIPFIFIGITQFIGPILLTLLYLFCKYEKKSIEDKQYEDLSETKLFDWERSERKLFIGLLCAFLAAYHASEMIYFEFASTYYQYIPLRLTAQEAARIVGVIAISYTIGRGLSALIAIKVQPLFMIVYHHVIITLAVIVLGMGMSSLTLTWMGSLMISYGMSASFPAFFAFVGFNLEMTDRIGAVFIVFSTMLTIFIPYVLGSFIRTYPITYLLCIISTLFLSDIILVFVNSLLSKTKRKYKSYSEKCCTKL